MTRAGQSRDGAGDLRFDGASLALDPGVPVHAGAERLGHAHPSITLRIDAHVLRQNASGVADVLAAAIEAGDDVTSVAVHGGAEDLGAAVALTRPLASQDRESENPRSASL